MNNSLFKNKNYKNIAGLIVLAMFFILDQFLKSRALRLSPGESLPLLGDWLNFRFVPNPYIAFSLPLSGNILNILLICLISALIFYDIYLILSKKGQKSLILPLTYILIGAISNVLDRISVGAVIDYFDLKYFTIFNLADVLITVGVVIILLSLYSPVKTQKDDSPDDYQTSGFDEGSHHDR